MSPEKILPSIMIILSFGSAIFYIPSGDYRMVAYWIAAAIITLTVTW